MGAITRTETPVRGTRRGQLSRLASRVIVGVVIALTGTVRLLAHDPGLSLLDVRIEPRQIVAVLSLAGGDAALVGGRDAFSKLTHDALQLSLDGRSISPSATSIWSDESGGLHGRMIYDRPSGSRLVLRSTIVSHLARGTSRATHDPRTGRSRSVGAHAGCGLRRGRDGHFRRRRRNEFVRRPIPACLASSTFSPATIICCFSQGSWWCCGDGVTSFRRSRRSPWPTPSLWRWRPPALSWFPVASSSHLIAASIVYVGIENLMRGVQGSRWKLTFGFGLVHGLGFATVLRDLGIGTNGNGAIALPAGVVQRGCRDRANGGRGTPRACFLVACRASDFTQFDLLPRGR